MHFSAQPKNANTPKVGGWLQIDTTVPLTFISTPSGGYSYFFHQFNFTNKLYSLDASTVDLCLSVFPWAKFKSTKSTVKLHVGLNHQGYLPEFVTITEGNVADITIGKTLEFPKKSIVVIDRGYVDHLWYK